MRSSKLLISIAVAVVSTVLLADKPSAFNRLKDDFDGAQPAKLADIPAGESTWIGRCVAEGSPNRRYGFLMTFSRTSDPILNDFVYALSFTHASPRHYVSLTATELQKVHDELLKNQDYYSELSEDASGLVATAKFTQSGGQWKEDVPGGSTYFTEAITIKVKQVAGQKPLFFVKQACKDSSCSSEFGYNLDYRVNTDEAGAYCYLDKQVQP